MKIHPPTHHRRRSFHRVSLALPVTFSLLVSILTVLPARGATPGLVAAYSFDEGTGTTVADASGNGNTGTISGATWTTSGEYGNALSFNGTSSRVNIPDAASLDLTTGMTLEAWVSPTAVTSKWRDVIYKGNDNYYLMATSKPSAFPAGGGTIGGVHQEAFGTGTLATNTFTHLAVTYDGSNVILYVNGAPVSTKAATGAITTSTNRLQIGSDNIYGQYFAGVIDEVRVYNVALNATDILADKNTPIGSGGTGDTQAPTWPSSSPLAAAPASSSQINLSWAAANDNVGVTSYLIERCEGTGCSSFAQIGTVNGNPPATTYNDTGPGLLANTSYSYRVRAADAVPNLSVYSNVASATTQAGGGGTPGLVAAYAFDEGTGTTVADASGNGNTGTISGATWTTSGEYGNALSFNGTSSRVNIPDAASLDLTTGMTLEAWVSPTAVTSKWRDVIYKGNDNYYLMATSKPSAFPAGGGTIGGVHQEAFGTGTLATNTFTHLAVTYDGSNVILYVNGAPVSTKAATGAITTSTNRLQIGSDNIYGQYFAGVIDEVRVYNVALNATDILADKNTPIGSGTGGTPDYVAEGLAMNPATLTGGELVSFQGTVRNAGTGTASVSSSTRLRLDINNDGTFDLTPANQTTTALAAGGSETETWSNAWTATVGTHRLEICADVGSAITESSDANNCTTLTFTVGAAPNLLQNPGFESGLTGWTSGAIVTSPVHSGSQALQISARSTVALTSYQVVPVTAGTTYQASGWISVANLAAGAKIQVQWRNASGTVLRTDVLRTLTGTAGWTQGSASLIAPTGATQARFVLRTEIESDGAGQAWFDDLSLGSGSCTTLSINPRTVTLTFTQMQQFTTRCSGSATATWSVDNVVGGNSSVGTITNTGLYTPPSTVGQHTITATALSQLANATAYITNYPGMFTYHYDKARTGVNASETVLSPSNVNSSMFGKLTSYPLDGLTLASPLYVQNVNVPGQGFHNLVYVATERDSVYAFDADGRSTTPIWKDSFINPANGVTTVPCVDVGECGDIPNEIGITSTPVIDSTTDTMYVVAKTKEVSGPTTKYVYRLHALDITTGAEKLGGPVMIQASVPGTGRGTLGNGAQCNVPPSQPNVLEFCTLRENQRTALLLSNGVVYFGFSSHGDQEPFHGWVMGYNATTLAQVMVFCTTPNGNDGGVWMNGDGLATDITGSLYFITADGTFDASTGGTDYGDSFVRLGTSGAVQDYFTPSNQSVLDANNMDLGSGGVLLLDQPQGQTWTHPAEMVSAGKEEGSLYLVDRAAMGHYGDAGAVQKFPSFFQGTFAGESGNFGSPLFFNGRVYFSPVNDSVQAFRLTPTGMFETPDPRTCSPRPDCFSKTAAIYDWWGGSPSISANGSSSGILWALQSNNNAASTLHAYDATDLTRELYNSAQAGSRDALDSWKKFTVPTVANGKVFVATNSQLVIYGLLP